MIDIDKIVKEITEPFLNEGVNDPGILKAVFLAGGPGSGKSFAANQLFGIPSKMNVSAYGLKMINQDAELERMLKKYGFGLDLDDMPEELFKQLTDPDYEDYSGMRGRAKELTAQRKKMYMNGRLGMIIDGTGHKFKKIKEQKKELEEIGYDCYMVFVHTDLDIAQKRNMERARKLNPEIVDKSWNEVQKNKIYFQGLFGGANFLMVDNSATLSPKQATKKFNMLVKKGIGNFINKPVKNYRGKKWIAKQKIMKEDIKIPVKVGDTILTGRFKNKKVQVKSIGTDDHGMPTINGKKVTTFRTLKKKTEIKESKNIKKVIGVFGGRFQPFHSGHLATYKWLSKQVDEAYITTSNIKKPPRHPMNFKEKVRHMVKVGIPKNRIIEEKTPYVAKNLLKKFNADTTAVVYAFGEKDAGRLKSGRKADGGKTYYQDYKKSKDDIQGYEKHGYFVTAPQFGNISGTKTRDMLGNPKVDNKEKIKFFKKTFGYYDQGLYNMMTNKFKKLFEYYIGLFESATGDIESVDDGPHAIAPGINRYMGRARKEAEKLGFDIVNSLVNADAYNSQDKLGSHAKPYPNGPVDSVSYGPAGIGDVTSNSVQNLVGTALWNKWLNHIDKILGDTEFEYTSDLIKSRSIAVKDSNQTAKELDKEIKESIQRLVSDLPMNGKELLLMGGAYGHMSHPFDDKDLTFGDLKKIINLGLSGQLSREDNVTEKTDGQNLMISWRDGKLIAARNKGHIKNKGKTALDIKAVESKFKGRGAIRDAFVYAMRDLSKAVGALSKKQQDKIFGQGSKFMSLEVMWPASENVVNYDLTELIFHGALEYDDSGKVIGQAKDSARMLQGMIKQVNQHVQKHYKISKPHFVTVPKHQDYGRLKKKFITRLQKLQNRYALKDNDTFALYHQMYWEEFIYNASKQYGYKISNTVLKNLTKRWAFFDKSYKIPQIKKDMKDNPKFLDWVLTTDKIDKNRMVKENMKPFEELFFEVGAEILKNMDGWMAVNPAKSVQNMRKKLKSAISDIRAGGDIKKLNKLKIQLDRLNAIGGFDAVVPTEGIVFKYNGNTYKFTGAFAPINQITGLMFF